MYNDEVHVRYKSSPGRYHSCCLFGLKKNDSTKDTLNHQLRRTSYSAQRQRNLRQGVKPVTKKEGAPINNTEGEQPQCIHQEINDTSLSLSHAFFEYPSLQ